jgi:Holliday junction resolvasome RuvABC endonuclease subunit
LKFHVDRLRELVHNQEGIIAACIEGPALNAVNRPDDAGQIRGTYLYALADLGIEVYDPIPPTSLKKFATGHGTASKDQMTAAANQEWPGTDFPTDDAVDAAWLAALARALHDHIPVTPSQLAAIRGIRESKPKTHFRLNRKNNI